MPSSTDWMGTSDTIGITFFSTKYVIILILWFVADVYLLYLPQMEEALYYKITQHPVLQDLLLDTGTCELIYDDADPYWGIGERDEGANHLGHADWEMGPGQDNRSW